MTALVPRKIKPEEIKHWPKMAFSLVWKEFPAWIILILIFFVISAYEFETHPTNTHFLAFEIAITMVWSFVAALFGFLLIFKAHENFSWSHLPYAISRIICAFRIIILIHMLVILFLVYAFYASDVKLPPSEDNEGISFIRWFFVNQSITPFLYSLCIIIWNSFLSFPLKYLYGINDEESALLSSDAAKINKGNILRFFGHARGVLIWLIMLFVAFKNFSLLLYPFFFALLFVACREIFIQQTKIEEESVPEVSTVDVTSPT